MTARRVRMLLRAGQAAAATWSAIAVVQLLTAEPALADNCGTFADCFGQTGSAAEATFGLTLLAGLSLVLDFVPIVGDVKGVVESVTGRDLLTGEELEPWERALGLIPLLPVGDLARAATKVDDLAAMTRHGDEAAELASHGDEAADAARATDDVPPAGPPRDGGDGGGGGRPPGDDGPPRAPDDEPPRAPEGSGPIVRATDGGVLRGPEIDTAHRYEAAFPGERLYDYQSRTGLRDYDYYDAQGRLYDQIGNPRASPHLDLDQFTDSIDGHVLKMSHLPPETQGRIIIDMTGFSRDQIAHAAAHIDGLPADQQALIVRIGF